MMVPGCRYLIFTTHVPFSLDGSSIAYLSPSLIPSQRKYKYSLLAVETDFRYFQAMANVVVKTGNTHGDCLLWRSAFACLLRSTI